MEERQNRIDEKPATFKKKGQMYLFILIGVIALLLTINMIYSIASNNKSKKDNQTQENSQPKSNVNNDPDRFESLLQSRQKELDKQKNAAPPKSPYDVKLPSREADTSASGGEQGTGGDKKDLVAEAERRFKAEEVMRALKARQTRYSDSGNSVAAPSSSAFSGSTSGTTRVKKDDNARRIAEIDQVQGQLQSRIKMMEAQVANGDESIRGQLNEARRDLAAQRSEVARQRGTSASGAGDFGGTSGDSGGAGGTVPDDVVGYSADNEYNASTEGKVKMKVGTEINAITTYTAISDYTGGTMKAMVTHDIYDATNSYILAPKGSELLIKAVNPSSVNQIIENRLAFTVRWLVLPNGNRIDFRKASVLNRMGTPAVEADDVNYHLMAQILGVTAYALVGTKTSYEGTGDGDESFAGNFGEGARQQAGNIAQKYLQVVPTRTLHAGAPIRIITEDEMFIKPWKVLYENYVD
ncbi:conjugal transfer protein TrbI [Klebsiella pneumoniae]|uniref:TrbI/VirB10 family protein n=1 Tax=Klebsiella pneumoniae TaxID=573 RepID=UPI0018A342F1|nr:TrbI/VirB10 family protein [Klebsiella pneumoniae]ELE4368163.1 conjugal transfer protein TrbI [Salmonella enterica]EIX9714757.1 conjugal transfer protein TrbI [Klebsiella pneumoniae]EMD7130172.1 conjugal transfer protein TrbI [Salmonella enterica]MDE8392903.1 conjugal transfer protein TrbI [Klebsiella pneumoniae]BBW89494.1 hypothetical protein THOKLE017_P30310 [Klebsiella pneumoniae]